MTAQLNVPAEIDKLLDDYEFRLSGTPKHWEKTDERIKIDNETVAALLSLLEQVGKEIIGHKTHNSKEWLSEYGWVEQEAINKHISAQRQTLATLLKGEKDG